LKFLWIKFAYCCAEFQSSLVVLALKEGASISDLETASLAIGLPFSFLWCMLGWVMVCRLLLDELKNLYTSNFILQKEKKTSMLTVWVAVANNQLKRFQHLSLNASPRIAKKFFFFFMCMCMIVKVKDICIVWIYSVCV
jgi:hypothetical protein